LHIPSENDLLYKSQEHRDTVLLFIAIALKLNNFNGLSIYYVEDEDIG
jgi:serum/glucocorticoid-regulated kinase 2